MIIDREIKKYAKELGVNVSDIVFHKVIKVDNETDDNNNFTKRILRLSYKDKNKFIEFLKEDDGSKTWSMF